MVLASKPVVSPIRLAALPVGAASIISTLSFEKIFKMALMIVVFPVPGPPVMTRTLLSAAHLTASIWLVANVMESRAWTYLTALSESISLMDLGEFIKALSLSATLVSERWNLAR